jgi:hypothetical protein
MSATKPERVTGFSTFSLGIACFSSCSSTALGMTLNLGNALGAFGFFVGFGVCGVVSVIRKNVRSKEEKVKKGKIK